MHCLWLEDRAFVVIHDAEVCMYQYARRTVTSHSASEVRPSIKQVISLLSIMNIPGAACLLCDSNRVHITNSIFLLFP